MGMPGMRAEYNPNPYISKQQQDTSASYTKSKVASGKQGKVYELGPSSLKGGIFGPPDTSAARTGGKQTRYNPASGTYTTERPY